MAKTKYSEEIAKIICDAIATQGGDESGWTAGAISQSTFYQWIKNYSEFSESVERARAEFRKNAPITQKRAASQRLTDVLENGQIIKWKKVIGARTVTRYRGSAKNKDILFTDIFSGYTEYNVEYRPTPQWAIERVIPKPVKSFEDLNVAAAEIGCEVVIKDADLFNRYFAEVEKQGIQESTRTGLSDEGVYQIRRRILGLDEESTSPTTVPGEVG